MIKHLKTAVLPVLALAAATSAAGQTTPTEPVGLWYDHTGRGAVEITKCGSQLCGRLVWLKDAGHAKQVCGVQIIGDAKPVKAGVWDNGWIYDPERDSKFSVELTLVNPQSLKVVGYMGTKWLSETMMWKRAPLDLKRCGA
jgi:uncharacterized protein (DUF2147 family)